MSLNEELGMRALGLSLAVAAISLAGFVGPSQSADLKVAKRYVAAPPCDHSGCRTRRFPPCPDRFSCYPLYGAYGPYGGVGYWAAYSYGYDYVYR